MTAPGEAPPTCYRHPGRETYVSCTRCGRYACPDCMRSASVGQHCVDCVRQAQQGVRQARAPLGAGIMGGGALVTKALVAINIVLFLVELVKPSLGTDWAMLGYATYGPGGAFHGVAAGEWYRLITSA